MIDSLRADHVGAYGYGTPTTPRIDAFARGATLFERTYSVAPWTLPSMATLFTGHYPAAVGIREEAAAVDADVTTLGELYRDAGYATGAVVSHIYMQEKYGLMQGMDTVDDSRVEGHHEIVSSKGLTTGALAFVKQHVEGPTPEQPMFLVVHYFDPHYNYILHPSALDTYPEYDGPLQSGQSVSGMRKVLRARGRSADNELRFLNNLYDSEIRYTDREIGRLLKGLRKRGRFDDALVVIMGDHGEELGDRKGRWIGHTKVVSEETLRVPLIIKPPGDAPPRRVSSPVSTIDLLPTIARLSGLTVPPELGVVGTPLNFDEPSANRSTVFSETGRWRDLRVAVRGDWKLVHARDDRPDMWKLYNLKTDPGELTNVADANPQIVTELQAELATWTAEVKVETDALSASGAAPMLTKSEIEALRAMGYLE